jgi:cell division inhibitor SepF
MALRDTIRNLFGNDDEYYDDYEYDQPQTNQQQYAQQPQQQAAQPKPAPSRPTETASANQFVQAAAGANSKIALFEPKVFSDARAIASQVLGGEAVIVNFTAIDDAQAKRILYFLGGATYAVNGEIERIGEKIFLVTPNTFEISGTLTDNLEPNSRF